MTKIFRNDRGLTLIELVVTMVILLLLGSLVIPSVQVSIKRTKEIELKRNLREIRTAIDNYKRFYDQAVLEKKIQSVENLSGYPKTLQVLVDGDDFGGLIKDKKKFLRRIPRDPFHPVTGEAKEAKEEDIWNLRSYADDPDTKSWGGQDVFDVSSKSDDTAIDGTKYKDW